MKNNNNPQVPSHTIVNVQTIDISVNSTDSNEKYNMINIRLNTLCIKALNDSGATVSCLQNDIYVKSGLVKQFPIEKSDINNQGFRQSYPPIYY